MQQGQNEQRAGSSLAARALLFAKGMAMGAADSVPGVSGGTIAFITNIYEELITSLKQIGPAAALVALRQGPRAGWHYINGTFLLVLVLGIFTSLLLLANVVTYLLTYEPLLLRAFFSGLVLASACYLCRDIERWRLPSVGLLLLGAGLTLGIGLLPQLSPGNGLWYYFLCGALAICAMILPGISGAFILLLLGAYAPVMSALRDVELSIIAAFGLGCIAGLLSFVRLLSWLFSHWRSGTMSFLLGVLLGSLYAIWPWQQGVAFRSNAAGEAVAVQFRSLLPADFERLTGEPSQWLMCLLVATAGFGLVLLLEQVSAPGRHDTLNAQRQ